MPQEITQDNNTPWSFGRIVDLHGRAKAEGVVDANTSLHDFATQMNDATGSQAFDQGLNDSRIKRASLGIDKALEFTHIPDATAKAGEFLGGLVSPELAQKGEEVGRGFPRGAIDSSLVLGGMGITAASEGIGAPLGVPMMVLGGGSTFAKTYTDTDSPVAGLINTAATFALPKFMSKGAELTSGLSKAVGTEAGTQIVGGAVGKGFTSNIGGVAAKVLNPTENQLPARLVDLMGMNLGAVVNQELASQSTSLALHQGLQNPFTEPRSVQKANSYQ